MTTQSRVVWSSDDGERIRYCPRCGEREQACRCATRTASSAGSAVPRDGVVRLARSKSGRGGKVVTLVTGLPGTTEEIERLARELKKYCGVGGTVRDGVIELQGEQREKLLPKLSALGYHVKIAGG